MVWTHLFPMAMGTSNMATINDLNIKRGEMNAAIADYKQALADFKNAVIEQNELDSKKQAAQEKGDEYAKLAGQVKKDNPSEPEENFFSNPTAMAEGVRADVATIMTTGQLLGDGLVLLVDTEGDEAGATNVILPFDDGSDITVDWGDETAPVTYTAAASHNYAAPGVYQIVVTGTVNGFTATGVGYRNQLKDVMQWGNVQFASMTSMFHYRTGFTISASDAPTLLPDCDLSRLFYFASDFNSDIAHWDVSNANNMTYSFSKAEAFNGDLSSWDMSGVLYMDYMFFDALAFNQPINAWDVSSTQTMVNMFRRAPLFNQPLDQWNTGNVVNMSYMFRETGAFNQDLTMWDVGNVPPNTGHIDFNRDSVLLNENLPNFS